jgi:excisionase family DNA binding protein
MDIKEQYYTVAQAAKRLGVHYETAARWVRSGRLPAIKLSRRRTLIPKRACNALLAVPTGSPAAPGALAQWLPWIGGLTAREAARLRELIQDFEKVEDLS